MKPGSAAVCRGEVWHQRTTPVMHQFRYPVRYVWIDPDRPGDLTAAHPLWSHRRPAPVWFRRGDYATPDGDAISEVVTRVAAEVVPERSVGEIRMLTQPRRWGWLFNPITVYVVWAEPAGSGDDDPVALVLEVTNTPWKERHHYAAALSPHPRGGLGASIPKLLHVSPFLDEQFTYEVQLIEHAHTICVRIAVVAPDGCVHLRTAITVDRRSPTRSALGRALWSAPLSTPRVSFGIHRQALLLWRRGVAFVAHPRKRVPPR